VKTLLVIFPGITCGGCMILCMWWMSRDRRRRDASSTPTDELATVQAELAELRSRLRPVTLAGPGDQTALEHELDTIVSTEATPARPPEPISRLVASPWAARPTAPDKAADPPSPRAPANPVDSRARRRCSTTSTDTSRPGR